METERPATRAWVLHPDLKAEKAARDPKAGLAEALALSEALPEIHLQGGEVVPVSRAVPATLFGSGKIEELKAKLAAEEIGLVLVDGPVTPVQQRNLEEAWGLKILDRTGLILEIFSDRARTREGVLQVEMAALSYQRTRLVRAWTHLERQRGGLGFVGGPGETQIEADRRAIDEQLTRLKRQLAKVQKTRALHRAGRAKVPFPIVALVGYTNAGKSTLFNHLTGAEVFAKDMLFATLDPTMRQVKLATGEEIILSDTVGFISDLPTELVAAFRATLEEVLEADVILHVRDIAHPETELQRAEVLRILETLGVPEDVPQVEVWNKVDTLTTAEREAVSARSSRSGAFLTSAMTGEGMDPLLAHLSEVLSGGRITETLTLDFAEGRRRAWLHAEVQVEREETKETGYEMDVTWSPRQKARFDAL